MIVHAKTKRRLVILLAGTLALMIAGAGGYFALKAHRRSQAIQSRADGLAALEAKDYFTALHKLGVYVQRFPNDAEILYDYGQARQHVKERDGKHIASAIAVYRRVLDLQPSHARARQALLDLYLLAGYGNETLQLADAVLAQSPADPPALRAKAIALARLRRFDEALAIAKRYGQLKPLDLEMHIMTFQVMAQGGQTPAQVLAAAEALRKAHPGDVRFDLLLGVAYSLTGDQKRAAASAQALAADKAAASKLAASDGASIFIAQLNSVGLFEQSLSALEEAAAKGTDPDAEGNLIARLFEKGRWQEIDQRLAKLSPQDPAADTRLLAYRAMALMQLNRPADARPVITGLADRRNDLTAPAWAGVLHAVFAEGKVDDKQVIRACQDGLSLTPGNPCFYFYAGEAYARLGEDDMAMEQWQSAAHAAPTWPAPLIRISRTAAQLGRIQEAFDAGDAALARAPRDPAAMAAKAVPWAIAATHGYPQSLPDALKLVEETQRLSPGEEQTLPIEVLLLAKGGKRSEAIQTLQAALAAKDAPSEQALLQLAEASRAAQLGLEQRCFDRSLQAHGLTAELALAQAKALHEQGKSKEGLAQLQAAAAGPHQGDKVSWDLALARYLELIQDPGAQTAWVTLADQQTENLQVQRLAIAVRSTHADHAFVGRAIDRLHSLTGEQALSWRMARAQWLLEGQPNDKDTAEAAVLLNDLVGKLPQSSTARLLLALCLERQGNMAGAVEQLSSAANLRPDSNEIALALARLLVQQGDAARARTYLDRVTQSKSITPEQRRTAAALLSQQGDAKAALAVLQGDADQQPDLTVAALYRQSNQPQKAEAVYRRLLAEPDESIIAAAADFYLSRDNKAEAQRVIDRLDKIQAKPGSKELIRGGYYHRLGDARSALQQYQAAAKSAPQSEAAWDALVAYQLLLGDPAGATAAIDEAAKALPANAAFQTLKQNGELVAAVKADRVIRPVLAALLSSAEDNAPAGQVVQLLADAKRKQESPDQTLAKLRTLADRNPRFLPVQVLVAQLYLQTGKVDQAITVATRAMATAPSAAEPAQIASDALAVAGRWSELLTVARQWRQRLSGDPAGADLAIATAQYGLENPKAALQQLQPYLERAKASPDAFAPMLILEARCQIQVGQVAAAQALLKPLLAKSAQWRWLWVQLASRQIADAKAAADWMTTAASAIPAASLDEQIMLVQGWQVLALRSGDPQHQAAAKQALQRISQQSGAGGEASPDALVALASLYEMNGDLVAAEAGYRKALALKADLPVAQNNLAMVIVNRGGDLREALALASKAAQAQQHPALANFRETLSCIQARLKDYPAAIANLTAALAAEPQNVEWRISLTQYLLDSGQADKAKAALDQVERLRPDPAKLRQEARARLEALRRTLKAGA